MAVVAVTVKVLRDVTAAGRFVVVVVAVVVDVGVLVVTVVVVSVVVSPFTVTVLVSVIVIAVSAFSDPNATLDISCDEFATGS